MSLWIELRHRHTYSGHLVVDHKCRKPDDIFGCMKAMLERAGCPLKVAPADLRFQVSIDALEEMDRVSRCFPKVEGGASVLFEATSGPNRKFSFRQVEVVCPASLLTQPSVETL